MGFENAGLDNVDVIKNLDKYQMYHYLRSQAHDTLKSYEIVNKKFIENNDIQNVIAAGIGGSGMAPKALKFLFRDELTVPFIISQEHSLPKFANSKSLLLAISDSGKTEEIINQYYQAKQKGAKVIAIGKGDKLIKIAEEDNNPYFSYSTPVPARANFGFMFGSALAYLEKFNLISENNKENLLESIDVIKELDKEIGIEVPTKENLAKKTALSLKGRIPLVYLESPFNSIGSRFAKMLNENAGLLAFYNYFPEFRHNELMAWSHSKEIKLQNMESYFISRFQTCDNKSDLSLFSLIESYYVFRFQAYDIKPKLSLLFLLDNKENSHMERELYEIKKTIDDHAIDIPANVHEFSAKGGSKVSRFFYLQYFMDMVAYYMGIMLGYDPSKTPVLEDLKSRLRQK